MNKKKQDQAEELVTWWLDHSNDEINRTVPKAIEYGATDLEEIGRAMIGSDDPTLCAQAGIAFYAVGKIHRILAAIKAGDHPSTDSWFDLGVYAKMAQRIQYSGSWPGVEIEALKEEEQ